MNVTLYDKNGNYFDDSITNQYGSTKCFNVTQYINNDGIKTRYNNYTVQVTSAYPGGGAGSKRINITANMNILITIALFHTLQLILNMDNIQNKVYIPGAGAVASASITNTSYTNPVHWYLASYLNNILNALVFIHRNTDQLRVNKSGSSHSLTISQELTNSKSFLVFTSGDWHTIDNRISLIESGEFLNKISPSFAHGLGISYVIKILLSYADIDVMNDLILQKGLHGIELRNTGIAGRKTMLNVSSA